MKTLFLSLLFLVVIQMQSIGQFRLFENDNKFGIKNSHDEIIVKAKYDEIRDFSGMKPFDGYWNPETIFGYGYAIVRNDKLYGVIDTNGREVIPMEYNYVEAFSPDFAIVTTGKLTFHESSVSTTRFCDECSEGIVDKSNQPVIPLKKSNTFLKVSDNWVIVLNWDEDYAFQLYTKEKKDLGKISYTAPVTTVSGGFVQLAESLSEDKNGFFFQNGTFIDLQYDTVIHKELSDYIIVGKDNKYGVLSSLSGKTMIECKYDFMDYASVDKFWAYSASEKIVLDTLGRKFYTEIETFRRRRKHGIRTKEKNSKILVEPQYDKLSRINSKNLYMDYFTAEKNGKYGIIDQHNDKLLPVEYDKIDRINNHYQILTKNGKQGLLIDYKKIIIPVMYDEIIHSEMSNSIFIIAKDGKYGMFSEQDQLVEPKYDAIEPMHEIWYKVKQDGKTGLIDNTGEVVLRPIFDDIKRFDGIEAEVIIDGKKEIWDKEKIDKH